MRLPSRPASFLLASLLLSLAGCDPELADDCGMPQEEVAVGDGDVFLWIGADRDAVVRCSSGTQCADGEANFGLEGSLAASNEPIDLKASYLHFHLPQLPPGSEIVEAYVELHHGGTMEDGQSDEQCLPMAPAAAAWDWSAITWNNQPNVPYTREFDLQLRSAAWSGTQDIAAHVQLLFDGTWPNDGFALFGLSPYQPYVDKGFDSNNSHTRKVDALGLVPRLLVRARLPESADASVTLPPLSEDNDMPFDGEHVLVALVESGDDWPAEWHVAATETTHFCQL